MGRVHITAAYNEGARLFREAKLSALDLLDEREYLVLKMRFEQNYTLEKISELMSPKPTRERVRQLQARAIKKLRDAK